MTDHLTDASVKELLDGAMPGPWRADGEPWNRVVWSSAENRVCFMAHSNGLNDERDIATSNLAAAAPELARALLAARADAKAAVAIVVEKAAEILDGYETIDDESAARGVRWQVDLPAQIASAIRARAPEDAIAEVAKLREEVKHKNGVIARLLTEAGHLDHARNNEQAMAVEAASERDRLAAELAAANAREAGLREALDMSHQGWRNALELDLLPKQHRHSAKTMADIAAAALASRPTEYEQKVAKMKEDFPNGI